MNRIPFHPPLLGAVIAACMGLSACGGGSGAASPVAGARCAPVNGPSDSLEAVLGQVASQANAVPEAGAAAADMLTALRVLTDAVDAVAAVVQAAAETQDPDQIALMSDRVGDLLSCSMDEAEAALNGLGGGFATGTPVDGAIDQALAAIATLQETLGGDPLAGGASGDLSVLTDQIRDVAGTLAGVVEMLPVDDSGLPENELATGAMLEALNNFADLVDAFGAMDEEAVAAALDAYFGGVAALLSDEAVSAIGMPVALPVAALFDPVEAASADALAQLQQGFLLVLGPVFDAVGTVLGGGAPALADFQSVLLGTMAGSPLSGEFGALVNSLAGGTGDVPAFGQLLSGMPVLAELVATALGASGDPSAVLGDLLAGDLEQTLAEVLADLPGISAVNAPFSSAELGALTDVVADMLSVAGAGGGLPGLGQVSEIELLLANLGGDFTGHLDDVGDLLDGVLGLLLIL